MCVPSVPDRWCRSVRDLWAPSGPGSVRGRQWWADQRESRHWPVLVAVLRTSPPPPCIASAAQHLGKPITPTYSYNKMDRNMTSNFQVISNFLIKKTENSCQGQRSRLNVNKIEQILCFIITHIPMKLQVISDQYFYFCTQTHTHGQTPPENRKKEKGNKEKLQRFDVHWKADQAGMVIQTMSKLKTKIKNNTKNNRPKLIKLIN